MNDDNNIISPLPGLILIPNFITKEEEQYLIDEINNNEWVATKLQPCFARIHL